MTIQEALKKVLDKAGLSIEDIDLLVVSTDTPDSRNFSNATSVETGVPAVYISLHERARTGSVYRIVPGVTGCRNCIGDGRWAYEFIPGTKDYSEAENERDILFLEEYDPALPLVLGNKNLLCKKTRFT